MSKVYTLDDFKLRHESLYLKSSGFDWFIFNHKNEWSVAKKTNVGLEYLMFGLSSLEKAKQWLFINYQVPMSGWKASSPSWRSSDGKWLINKHLFEGNKWSIKYTLDMYWCKTNFKTKAQAIGWINQLDSSHFHSKFHKTKPVRELAINQPT